MPEKPTLQTLAAAKKAAGLKQTRKAVRDGSAQLVYLACDADPAVTDPLADLCAAAGVSVVTDYAMGQIGRACGIAVGASAAAVLKAQS